MTELSPSSRSLRVADALKFLDEVKRHVSAADYSELLAILTAYQAKTIDAATVAGRVKDLFKDHPTLIQGFNAFLPEELRANAKASTSKL